MWCLLSSLARAEEPSMKESAEGPLAIPSDDPPSEVDEASEDEETEPEAPPIVPMDLSTLPWQIQNEAMWARSDRDATRFARIGGYASIASGMMLLGGTSLLVAAGNDGADHLLPSAAAVTVIGSAGVIAAPPLLLGASLRANRSLRERGVYVSSAPAVAGWTLYGASIFLLPLFASAWPLAPVYYGAILACGYGQMEVNRIGRRDAHLELGVVPTGDGLALTGRF